jgi:hypothetical protein
MTANPSHIKLDGRRCPLLNHFDARVDRQNAKFIPTKTSDLLPADSAATNGDGFLVAGADYIILRLVLQIVIVHRAVSGQVENALP